MNKEQGISNFDLRSKIFSCSPTVKSLSIKFYFLFSLASFLLFYEVNAQNTGFPENWGIWKTWILLTPENLGPNALPVPEIRNGTIKDISYFNLSGYYHNSSYDKTYNPYFKISIPFAEGRVAVEVWSSFFDYFEADTASLIERKAWNKSPTGFSGGDIYFATLIQIIRKHAFLPDMMISINLKTASGNNLEALRHTDTPGYYFDLSMGKEFRINEKYILKPYGLFGFYVYQTHQVMALQNDALLWGGGLLLSTPRFDISGSIGGYHGYFDQGDRPIVIRFSSDIRINKSLSGTIGFQKGLHDYPYKTLSLGINVLLTKQNS